MLAIELHGMHPFVLILICLAIGLSLRRSARRCRRFEPIRYATRELKAKKETTQAKVYQHRIQLHDTARETQAVLQAQVAVLDQIAASPRRVWLNSAKRASLILTNHSCPAPNRLSS